MRSYGTKIPPPDGPTMTPIHGRWPLWEKAPKRWWTPRASNAVTYQSTTCCARWHQSRPCRSPRIDREGRKWVACKKKWTCSPRNETIPATKSIPGERRRWAESDDWRTESNEEVDYTTNKEESWGNYLGHVMQHHNTFDTPQYIRHMHPNTHSKVVSVIALRVGSSHVLRSLMRFLRTKPYDRPAMCTQTTDNKPNSEEDRAKWQNDLEHLLIFKPRKEVNESAPV